jgi:hypothetical protein
MNAEIFAKFIMRNGLEVLADWVLPMMLFCFVAGVTIRALIFYTVKAEARFSQQFEKKVYYYLSTLPAGRVDSFYRVVKQLLERTYYENFELRNRYKRRNLDHAATVSDRLFLIEAGVARLMKDTLKGVRYFRYGGAAPRFKDLSQGVFESNPVFNRILGIFPAGMLHEFLGILPGLFVIMGIFGTFLGIMKGLPGLGEMDLGNIEESKKVMDAFLLRIAYSMVTSSMGIFLSIVMTLINNFFSADALYFSLVNRYAASLETLWNESKNNEVAVEDLDKAEEKDRRMPPASGAPTNGTPDRNVA